VITDVIDASGDLKDHIIEPVDYPLIDGKTDVHFCLSVGPTLGCVILWLRKQGSKGMHCRAQAVQVQRTK
jgi:hypothetical protein